MGMGSSTQESREATIWPQEEVEARPNLFGNFLVQDADENPVYAPVPSYDALRAALDTKLAEHNESNTVMDLVLFQQVSCGHEDRNYCAVWKSGHAACEDMQVSSLTRRAKHPAHCHEPHCCRTAGNGARVPDHTDPEPASWERHAGRGRRLRQAVPCEVHSVSTTVSTQQT